MVGFICNICGRQNSVAGLTHEESSCEGCGSNIRLRAFVYLFSRELFGEALLLPEFPPLPSLKGLGLSDQVGYAEPLAGKFGYTNTFYDREPRLDITARNTDRYGTCDFLLASDVFEHVAVPVERAFDEACKLLKPHGVLCMSVPFSLYEETIERFPDLHEFALATLSGVPILVNRTADGALHAYDGLIFHGGVGSTLEMRIFSQKDLTKKLLDAGFSEVSFLSEAAPEFGIAFDGPCSLPLVARKGKFAYDKPAVGQLAREYASLASELDQVRRAHREAARHIERLDAELAERGEWARGLELEVEQAKRDLERLRGEFEERTRWALELQADQETASAEAARLRDLLQAAADSRWIRVGNRFGFGPKL